MKQRTAMDAPRPSEAALVIVNPRAGGGISQRKWARLVGAISAGLGELHVQFTDARGHATLLARDAALAGRRLIVAFGGDGTISEIAGGILAARDAGGPDVTELGIISKGTGGDFRRTLEVPHDAAQAAERIRLAAARLIDVGHATFTAPDGNLVARYFVNVASFGFSSRVAERANESSKWLGAKSAFVGATLKTLIAYQNNEVLLEIDGAEPVRRTVMLAALGNGLFFGGGMKICPEASLESGALSFVMVGDMGKLEVIANLHRLFAGTHLSLEDVRSATIHTLRAQPVEPAQKIPVELDGETPGHLPATFKVIPRALLLRY
jgi:diacylglycerol kinase (ATP)